MNDELAEILKANPKSNPEHMQRDFPRVFERISRAWGTEALDDIFLRLLVADGENRQGFPPEVAREIFAMHLLHEKYKNEKVDFEDPWAGEPDMTVEESALFIQGLAGRGREFTPAALFKVVEKGETAEAFNYIRAGMDVDIRRSDEWTPLMVALFNGQEETAMMLLSRGANVRAKAKHGYEPIHWAALNGYDRAMRFILDKGGNANAETEFGWTPLLQAGSRGHVVIARLLIQRGAMVNASEQEGWAPLHKACANGHVEMARFLVARGADPRQRSNSGVTPLELAIKAKNFDLIEAISEPAEKPS